MSASSPPTLASIAVSPPVASLSVGTTQQFTATGSFSDGSTQDLTSRASWASSDPAKVVVQTVGQASPGFVAATAAGTATISAGLNGHSGSSTVTVINQGFSAVPLMDMTAGQTYKGFQGGLYGKNSNTVLAGHDAIGLTQAAAVLPLDSNGNPSPSGKVVFMSIGMSNAHLEFSTFVSQAASDSHVNHTTLAIVDGAQSGMTACAWTDPVSGQIPPDCGMLTVNPYDVIRDSILPGVGLTEKQVQVVWIKDANAVPANKFLSLCDPSTPGCVNDSQNTDAIDYESELGDIIRATRVRYPNLKQVFLSSRIYAGYATSDLNPEPFAYEYGFSVQFLINAQINQESTGTIDQFAGDLNDGATGPGVWAVWGPYLWADGGIARSDGLTWVPSDYNPKDFTHPGPLGQQKVSNMLMDFFLNSAYTPWFRP